ncbi:MAG TPA: EsaB/YukD family protein, partial [Gemmataceae bacterium]|nr:EsaB/YukD family protein [Gemmataceae bacterium]
MQATAAERHIKVEAPSGEQFEAVVPAGTPLKDVAANFFQSQGWPLQDEQGRGQRAVVELVDPDNPDNTRRLDGNQALAEANIQDGDTLRIFPEAIAGAADP